MKLVRFLQGEVLDFIVDLRRDSSTFKKWICQVASVENCKQLYLPSGYRHAYVNRVPDTVVLYKFDDYYNKDLVRAIHWNDLKIGISWDKMDFFGGGVTLSSRDANALLLQDSDINLILKGNS